MFSQNVDLMLNNVLRKKRLPACLTGRKPFFIAIIPFHCVVKNELSTNFSDSLAVHLSSSLTAVKGFAVISHNMIRRLPEKFSDIKSITDLFDADLAVTGDVFFHNNVVRVFVQVMRTDSFEQMWSMMIEKKMTPANMLSIQDEIVELISDSMQKDDRFIWKPGDGTVMAVA